MPPAGPAGRHIGPAAAGAPRCSGPPAVARAFSIALAAVLLALALCAGGAAAQSAPTVTIEVDPFDPGRPVPERFLGLSFEAAALGQLSQYSERGDLVRLLRSLGPGMLRFGGITADE